MTRGGATEHVFVQIRVLTVPVSTANRGEHGVTAKHLALVKLTKMYCFVMGSESPLVTVELLANVAHDGRVGRRRLQQTFNGFFNRRG